MLRHCSLLYRSLFLLPYLPFPWAIGIPQLLGCQYKEGLKNLIFPLVGLEFTLWATPGNAQGLLLALPHPGVTPACILRGPYGVLRIKPVSALGKAMPYLLYYAVLSHQLH